MNHMITRWIGRCLVYGTCVLGIELSATAQTVTNGITNVAYAEKYSRAVKFQHLGPFLGHHYDFTEKGSVVLQFTVSLQGVDTTMIAPTSLFAMSVNSTEGEELYFEGSMSLDPKFQTGGTKAKFTFTDVVDGKVIKWGAIKFAINPVLELLTISIKAKSTASYRDGNLIGETGESLLADNFLDSASTVVLDNAEIQFLLSDGNGDPLLFAAGIMTYGGEVQATPQEDPEIGIFNAYKIGLVGASPVP